MTRLISKVQYRYFEAGELIELTNPSITIEGKNDDFLKLALFFNNKFVIHYFDDRQILFTKSFANLEDGYIYIKHYFEQSKFAPVGFKKERTLFQHNTKHFLTQDFRYLLTGKSIRNYLLSTSGINLFFSDVFLMIILFRGDTVIFAAVFVTLLANCSKTRNRLI